MELTLKPLTKFGLGWAEVVTQVEKEEKTNGNHHKWTVAVDTQASPFPPLYRHALFYSYNILEGKCSRSQIPTTVLKSKRFWSTKGFYWFCLVNSFDSFDSKIYPELMWSWFTVFIPVGVNIQIFHCRYSIIRGCLCKLSEHLCKIQYVSITNYHLKILTSEILLAQRFWKRTVNLIYRWQNWGFERRFRKLHKVKELWCTQ